MLYTVVLMLHSVLRWLVLIAAVAVIARAFLSWFGRRPWVKLDDRLGLIYTALMDTQLLVGLILYIFLSPLTRAALADLGAAMKEPTLMFFAIEHIFTMVVAVVLAHVGRALSRRAAEGGKHQRAALWYTLSLLAILVGIPWPFLAYGRSLNPFWILGG
jgi:hypothetical protein